jgi:hypothetical protein
MDNRVRSDRTQAMRCGFLGRARMVDIDAPLIIGSPNLTKRHSIGASHHEVTDRDIAWAMQAPQRGIS